MSAVVNAFGSTPDSAQLQRVFGPEWALTLAGYQVNGESCVYYLDAADRRGRVYQLCFNAAKVLVGKASIDASSPSGA